MSRVIMLDMENQEDTTQINQSVTGDLKPKKPRFNYFWIILGVLFIALATGYWFSRSPSSDPDLSLSPSEVEQLSAENKIIVLEKQLVDLQNKERSLTPESDIGDRYTTYIQLGEVYTALGRHEDALQALDKIKEERKGNTRLWMTYAEVYKNMGDLPKARENIRTALDLDPELVDNWLKLFSVMSDMSKDSQESMYKLGLQQSGNLSEIQAAYDQWKNSQ